MLLKLTVFYLLNVVARTFIITWVAYIDGSHCWTVHSFITHEEIEAKKH